MSGPARLKLAKSHMATDFEFEVAVDDSSVRRAESVAYEAHALVDGIEDEITEFRATSPVWILNHAPVKEWVSLSSGLVEVLRLSQRLSAESGGYFNILSKSESGVDVADLEIDLGNRQMRRLHPGLCMGFGAIGKGYALDRVASVFQREGFTDFRLNSGGSSWIFSGRDENTEAWKISWAWKRDQDGDLAGRTFTIPVLNHEPLAVGVSGVLEQGNHFRYQGAAAPENVRSAFYAGRSAAEADALSTALLIGASVEGDGILTKLENGIRNPALAYVDLEEQIVYNRCFQTRFLANKE